MVDAPPSVTSPSRKSWIHRCSGEFLEQPYLANAPRIYGNTFEIVDPVRMRWYRISTPAHRLVSVFGSFGANLHVVLFDIWSHLLFYFLNKAGCWISWTSGRPHSCKHHDCCGLGMCLSFLTIENETTFFSYLLSCGKVKVFSKSSRHFS